MDESDKAKMRNITDISAEELMELFKAAPPKFEFRIERESVEPGQSFSASAMEGLLTNIKFYIGSQVLARWEARNEPPTVLVVKVEVEVY